MGKFFRFNVKLSLNSRIRLISFAKLITEVTLVRLCECLCLKFSPTPMTNACSASLRGAQWYEQFLRVTRLYRALNLLYVALHLPGAAVALHLPSAAVSSIVVALYI